MRAELQGSFKQMMKRAKPEWLKTPLPCGEQLFKLKRQLEQRGLSTICQSARCPNMSECWPNGHATFLIMGDRCTRNCGFCSVNHAPPLALDSNEANQVSEMVSLLNLKYAVITSVTRDDLPDRGSRHFADMISKLKSTFPALKIEVLIPDFDGRHDFINRIIDAGPDVLGHNVETVARLYPQVNRPAENFDRSMSLLEHVSRRGAISKTGLMVGLGESQNELSRLFDRLADIGVRLMTIGQYLQPVSEKVPVSRYLHPDEFVSLRQMALDAGISGVVAGPFVRSSYHAEELYQEATSGSPHQEGYQCVI